MLFLAIIGLAVPTIIATTGPNPSTSAQIEQGEKMRFLRDSVAFILLIVYVAGILFAFITHKHLFTTRYQQQQRLQQIHNDQNELSEDKESTWTKKKSFVILFMSIVGVVIVSEILVSSVEVTAEEYGFGELFIGVIIVGLVGNAAEHSSAVMLASRNKLDLSIVLQPGLVLRLLYLLHPFL